MALPPSGGNDAIAIQFPPLTALLLRSLHQFPEFLQAGHLDRLPMQLL